MLSEEFSVFSAFDHQRSFRLQTVLVFWRTQQKIFIDIDAFLLRRLCAEGIVAFHILHYLGLNKPTG
ncbi:hypothetical protein CMV_004409 [Castanea mollissima]|uniref:Uncharacterized protein n=1 Tax=Castanea mollissima TaxID=60419 RepID=A0A8J4VU04_9ROSI|nr:hypothetical protein CMV_004409 [Castanea mollissima]